jgi:outer membrane protein assembly factor BamA
LPVLSAGLRAGRLDVELGPGEDSRFPSIEQRFSDAGAPGLNEQPAFLYRELFVDFDSRDARGNPRSGGHYRAAWLAYDDRDFDRYSFSRFSLDASHFFPIFDKKRVFLVRGRVISSTADEGSVVPFYLRPTLGGSHSLRSVDDFRFRDTHMMVFNAEYRWEALSGLDMTLFADAGKVASTWDDLDLGDLHKAYGIGFRFNSATGIFYRIDIARGEEGFKFHFKFSGPFKDRDQWPVDTRSHHHRD